MQHIDQDDLNSNLEDDIDNENDDLELNVALFAEFASQKQFF